MTTPNETEIVKKKPKTIDQQIAKLEKELKTIENEITKLNKLLKELDRTWASA